MTPRTVINIVHRKDEWHVLRSGAIGPEGRFKSKSDAIEKGRELAMREDSASLRVTKTDGSIQSETVFGKDPSKIEGIAPASGFH